MSERSGEEFPQEGLRVLINQIQLRLERPKRAELDPKRLVRLYRALTGGFEIWEGLVCRKGFTRKELEAAGFLSSNGSFAEFGGELQRRMEEMASPDFSAVKRVQGLPVFLDLAETVRWVANGVYVTSPAVGVLELPVELLRGETRQIRLMRNFMNQNKDEELTSEEIDTLLTQGQLPGEYFITGLSGQSVPSTIRQHERIFRFHVDDDGMVDYGANVFEIDLTSRS